MRHGLNGVHQSNRIPPSIFYSCPYPYSIYNVLYIHISTHPYNPIWSSSSCSGRFEWGYLSRTFTPLVATSTPTPGFDFPSATSVIDWLIDRSIDRLIRKQSKLDRRCDMHALYQDAVDMSCTYITAQQRKQNRRKFLFRVWVMLCIPSPITSDTFYSIHSGPPPPGQNPRTKSKSASDLSSAIASGFGPWPRRSFMIF